jgi:hypothetical protein
VSVSAKGPSKVMLNNRLVVRSDAVAFGASGSRVTDAEAPALKLDASGVTVPANKALELAPSTVLSIPQTLDVFGTVGGDILSLPVSDNVIDASYSFDPIPVSKFDASIPLAVRLGGTGVSDPIKGAALVGNGDGPLASVPEIRFGSATPAGSLDIAGGVRLAAVDGQGNATGETFAISSSEDGWGRPVLALERPGGDRIDIASPLISVYPVVTSMEAGSVTGDARVYGVTFAAYRPSNVYLAAFPVLDLGTPVTAMRVVAGYRAVAVGGGDVSAAPPVGSTGSGTGVFRSVYNTSHAIVVPQGFLGTIACAVTDAWGNLSPVYAIDA